MVNNFQRLLLTRPPERNSEGTRFDVWMRTDEGVKFLGTGEIVDDLPVPHPETEQERKARIGREAVAFLRAEGER